MMARAPIPVLFVHASDELYGSDNVIMELVLRIDRDRFEPIVALPTDLPYGTTGPRLSEQLRAHGVPVVFVDFAVLRRRYLTPRALPAFAWRLVMGSWRLARLARQRKVGLVHASTNAVLGGPLGARLARLPLLWQVHELVERPAWLNRGLSALVVRLAHCAVAVSEPVAVPLRAAAGTGRAGRVVVVNNAVDAQRYTPQNDGRAVRAAWGVADDEMLVGVIGRLSAWKGQEVLVEAAGLLAGRGEGARLRYVLVGDIVPGQPGPRDQLMARIAALGLGGEVILAGYRTDTPVVMAALDVLALTSTSPEPFGLVVVEAMATGKPVIATAQGGPLEIVVEGETGLLVPPRDPAALAVAIQRLAKDPAARIRMGAAGRKRAVERFDYPSHVAAFDRLYVELLEARGVTVQNASPKVVA